MEDSDTDNKNKDKRKLGMKQLLWSGAGLVLFYAITLPWQVSGLSEAILYIIILESLVLGTILLWKFGEWLIKRLLQVLYPHE